MAKLFLINAVSEKSTTLKT